MPPVIWFIATCRRPRNSHGRCWPNGSAPEVWIKHENHTPTGAFKVRGGLIYLDELTRAQPDCPGIVTATRGNHGQSIPFAARAFGIPVSVLVPNGNSVEKNAAMRGWGATVETFGDDFEDARQEAVRRGEEEGQHVIGPFHEPLVRGRCDLRAGTLRGSA